MREFARFEKRTGNVIQTLQGRVVPGQPRAVVEPGKGARVTPVPADYRRVPVRRAWLQDTWCRLPVDRAALRAKGALTIAAWERAMQAQRRWLTLKDVRAWKAGRTVDVLILHRNAADLAEDEDANPRGKAIPAPQILRASRVRLTPQQVTATAGAAGGALDAALSWPGGGEAHSTHLHVQVRPGGAWYPLDADGTLPAKDGQGFFRLLGRPVHWTALPPSTRVGWRGPMMLWSSVAAPRTPALYWE